MLYVTIIVITQLFIMAYGNNVILVCVEQTDTKQGACIILILYVNDPTTTCWYSYLFHLHLILIIFKKSIYPLKLKCYCLVNVVGYLVNVRSIIAVLLLPFLNSKVFVTVPDTRISSL